MNKSKIWGSSDQEVALIRLHSRLTFFSCEIECYAQQIREDIDDSELLSDVATELEWAVSHLERASDLLSDKFDLIVAQKESSPR